MKIVLQRQRAVFSGKGTSFYWLCPLSGFLLPDSRRLSGGRLVSVRKRHVGYCASNEYKSQFMEAPKLNEKTIAF